MRNFEELVLGGILTGDTERLWLALQRIEADHFRDQFLRGLFLVAQTYNDITGGILTLPALMDVLEGRQVEATKQLAYEQRFTSVTKNTVTDSEFRFALDMLRDRHAHHSTGEAITDAFEILDRGLVVGDRELKGHRDAREYLFETLTAVDHLDRRSEAPEGFLHEGMTEFVERYISARDHPTEGTVQVGLKQLDDETGGIHRGELVLICGSAGEGKSTLATQFAWNAATQEGKTVLFLTSETLREQVIRRLVARHSRRPGADDPVLDTWKMRHGQLSDEEERSVFSTWDDLVQGVSNGSYGPIYVSQLPRGATIDTVAAKLNGQLIRSGVDLVVVDYLMLLASERRRSSHREELNDILQAAKILATTAADGRGVALVSPWQVNREARQEAQRTGRYTLESLAETSEAEKSADQVLALLRLESGIRLEVLKNRDGPVPEPIPLQADFASCFIGPLATPDWLEEI